MGAAFSIPLDYASSDGKSHVNAKLWTSVDFGGPDAAGEKAPRGVVQIVHGMAEHIDRYDELASYLVGRGFVVCAEDHVGHGKTASRPEELGHLPARGGKDVLLADVHTLHRMAGALFPGVASVMYGHSMGSFITRAYLARWGDGLDAAVLSGTGNVAAGLSRAGGALARALGRVRGETFRSRMIDNLGAGAYGKQIEGARTPLDWLSTDEAVVEAYREDERCGFMFTVGGYATLLDLTAEVVTKEHAEKVPRELPLLFVAGSDDPVGEKGAGVHAAVALYREAGVRNVDEIIYDGMRHEIHNEPGRSRVYDDVASWIESHVGGSPRPDKR